MKPSKVLSLFAGLIILIFAASDVQGQAVTFLGPELLARPTDQSITLNAVSNTALEAYVEYGTSSGSYAYATAHVSKAANEPIVIAINGLSANTKYYYRLRYRVSGSEGSFSARPEHAFQTQRPRGSTFTFTIISDSHMNGGGGNVALYEQTLENVGKDNPDFHLDLGDTFWMDNVTDSATANQHYLAQRQWMGAISPSAAIFVAPGNHEQEEAWHLDDTGDPATSLPVLSANARKKYFPNPIPDTFYSGNTDPYSYLHGNHLREDYYAWTWGDALFVVIDPYWYTTTKPFFLNAGGGEGHDVGSGDRWDWTLGLQQFNWLKQTLENSDATFKFVFDHHPLGGAEDYVRGGANYANLVEWGGYNLNGTTWAFNTRRPGWGDIPIHQLMVANHVSAYFHGHDHLYAYEARDGVIYQEVPSPAFTGSPNSGYYSGPYTIKVLPSPGHLRVTVSPSRTTVDYVNTNTGLVNHSYTIDATPLPIQMASFTASVVKGNSVEVTWKTVSETNNYGFEIHRRRGEIGEWSNIAFIEGHGTTLAEQSYTYLDRSLGFGKYYYQINQVDLDGKSEAFPEAQVAVGVTPGAIILAQNYPNPFNPSTVIEFVVPQTGYATVKVYNLLGQEVATAFEGNAEAEKINTARFDATNLPSGMYFYTLRSAGKVETKRMLSMK
jgi:hypothetical protein